MKKHYVLFIFLLMAAYSFGQQPVDVPKQNSERIHTSDKAKAIESHFYGCPQCTFVSKVKGVCPYHQLTLLKIGTYYCPEKYHYTSAKKGSCPQHKITLKEMEINYSTIYPVSGDKTIVK